MKSKLAFSLIFILVFLLIPSTIVSAGGQKSGYAWVLVDVKDYEQSVIKSTEENSEFTFTFEYSRGNYSVRRVYDGESREVIEEKYVHGETYGALCEFDEPPQTIGVGETVTLDVSMTETENTLSGWTGLAHGYAKFVDAEQSFTGSSSSDISFRDNTGSAESWRQTLDAQKGISSVETKITAIAPEGERGDRIALRLVFNIASLAIGTDYIYELRDNIPVITGPGNETQPGEPTDNETDGNETDPWTHAGPLATIVISIAAALAAVLGTAIGSSPAADSDGERTTADDKDPAYEKSKIPGYPEYVVGREGEHLSKLPNGNIQITYPTGEIATHYPNGDLERMQSPDGSTWELRQDGTITEKKANGSTIIRNNEMDVLSVVTPNGMVITEHPEDPDAFVIASPYGGSVVCKKKSEYVIIENSEGRLQTTQVEKEAIEGTIKTADGGTVTFNPDGSQKYLNGKGDTLVTPDGDLRNAQIILQGNKQTGDYGFQTLDGSYIKGKVETGELEVKSTDGSVAKWNNLTGDLYVQNADGSYAKGNLETGDMEVNHTDGTVYKGNLETGEFDFRHPDGSYAKGNSETGEVDAQNADGSFWKRDEDGNGSFEDKATGQKGLCRSDGSFRIENENASQTQKADGTLEFRTNNGAVVVQKPDGTVNSQLPDGRTSLDTPDGSKTISMPDGTVFQKTPDGQNLITKPDGTVQNASQDQYNSELDRYNDWYNKQLESKLNGR